MLRMSTLSASLGLVLGTLCLASAVAAELAPPRVLVEGITVELVAKEPEIVTPVGMAFDKRGRLLVVESHTHKRQDDYSGPRHDRIRTLTDADGDGKPETWGTFAEGYTHAMNLAVHPSSGDVYLVCRNEVHRLRDTDDDGVADEDEVIVWLETNVKYPHNGLGGIAVTTLGLAIGLGENFGAEYRLIGSDGSELNGRGGVGIVFQCDRDGGKLDEFAKGLWNPFGLCHVDYGGSNLFAVDNDPHASPPCRLLHVLPGGDYGHRWEYSSSGLHPLQAWNGELPGTLGMMAGTGEAPCAVLMHRGWLWVTSWGEHRIERYRLTKETEWQLGAEREVVVQGEADFRPTGMTVASDGSLYFADWVSRSYPVHGAGRIWRMRLAPEVATDSIDLPACLTATEQIAGARYKATLKAHGKPELGASPPRNELISFIELRQRDPKAVELLRKALRSDNSDVRLYAVRWAADEHLTVLKDDVAQLLTGAIPSERYYLAVLAAVDWLDGEREPRVSSIANGLLARELRNRRRSPEAHALALRIIDPNHKQLTIDAVKRFLASDHLPLRAEAIRTLAAQSNSERLPLLASIAQDPSQPDGLRADAVAGLAADAAGHIELLKQLADEGPAATRDEARRILRLTNLQTTATDSKPPADDIEAWLAVLSSTDGDAESGRRLFHGAVGARCAACHQHSGRGGKIGPELTHVGAKLSRRRLLESILQPSREIAPQYQGWVLETVDGKVLTGLRLAQGGDTGVEPYADSAGKRFTLRSEEVEARTPSNASIMPTGLEQLISVQDLRDLLAFLQAVD